MARGRRSVRSGVAVLARRRSSAQLPTCHRIAAPRAAATANQATAGRPSGTTMNAASSGPSACPPLPPNWNSDCAVPNRPPDAIRATRELSGWNTADPMPISIAPDKSQA